MIPRKAVRELMTGSPITIVAQARIVDAAQRLLHHKISGLPVVDDEGTLLGIVTEQDCLAAAHEDAYHDEPRLKVRDIMSQDVVSVGPDVDVSVAIELFLAWPYRRLPVLESGKLIGVVSRRDCLKALLSLSTAAS